MDVLQAEGVGYFEMQIEEIGGHCHEMRNHIFSIQSSDTWGDVVEKVESLGMFIFLYRKVELLKTTLTKSNLNNYVFICR